MRRAISVAVGICLLGGCARFAGKRATEGAMDTLSQKATAGAKPGEVPFEAAAGKAVDGALAHLREPENVAALRAVTEAVAEAAVQRALEAAVQPTGFAGRSRLERAVGEATDQLRLTATHGLVGDLGASGEGPLTGSVSAAARAVASAAADGALVRLRTSCGSDDPQCLERVEQLGHAAATGFASGLRASLGLWALAAAFVLGVLLAVAGILAGTLVRRLRHTVLLRPHGQPSGIS